VPDRRAGSDDGVDLRGFERPSRHLDGLEIALGVANIEDDVLPFLDSQLSQPVSQAVEQVLPFPAVVDDAHSMRGAGRVRRSEEREERAQNEGEPENDRRACHR